MCCIWLIYGLFMAWSNNYFGSGAKSTDQILFIPRNNLELLIVIGILKNRKYIGNFTNISDFSKSKYPDLHIEIYDNDYYVYRSIPINKRNPDAWVLIADLIRHL